jgi:hypothetical protein
MRSQVFLVMAMLEYRLGIARQLRQMLGSWSRLPTTNADNVVDAVAEEGSSMDEGTPNSVEMENASSVSVGGANTSNADNVVDGVAEEGSSMDEGTPNSVEMEDVSSRSVGGTNTTNADNVNGGAEE